MLTMTAVRVLSLFRQILLPARYPGIWRYLQRVVVLLLFLPLLLLLQALHWVGFLLDEILFRGYRDVEIREPVFVLGVPRSGTTFMHRLLAHHEEFTTFSTWECLFAPSISQRYLWLGVAAADRRMGRPLGRLLGWIERGLFGWLDDVHPMRLDAPEEDYFALLPVLSCFILVVPFPDAEWLWRLGRFDRDATPAERRRLLGWYRRCLQRHLYVHGPDKRLLSKNASFAGLAGSLVEDYPDSHLVLCERDAIAVIRSQFQSLRAGMRLFGIAENDESFRQNLLDCLKFYYENLDRVRAVHPAGRVFRVPLWTLSNEPRAVMTELCDGLSLTLPASLRAELSAYEASRKPRTERPFTAAGFSRWGIDTAEVLQRFGPWRHEEGLRI
jgi:hypothetical protein